MTYPVYYARSKDFTDEVGGNSDHASINAELDALALSIQQIIDGLKAIQRDDTDLANDSVGPDQLRAGINITVIEGSQELLDAKDAAEAAATTAESWAGVAEGHADTAEAWAETAEDTEVETGKYSAKHWAAKAEDYAGSIVAKGRKSLLLNGDFLLAQRGESQSSSGYASVDRWTCLNTGTTKTAARVPFTLGQTDVPGNPKHYFRHTVTSVAGASNLCRLTQAVEDVHLASGGDVTLSFWAKADSAKNIAVELFQNFGTGGSPSSEVTGIGAQKIALTTAWQQFVVTIAVPSISGKTLGSGDNDFLALTFWFDAGSSLDARTDSLGQQSGTFDIALVQLEIGDTASDFEHLPADVLLPLCQRYFCQSSSWPGGSWFCGNTGAGNIYYSSVVFPVTMRTTPVLTLTNLQASAFPSTPQSSGANPTGFYEARTANSTQYAGYFGSSYKADAEL